MNRLIYTRQDGGVSIVIPASKNEIEKVLGPLSDEKYEVLVVERSIPKGIPYKIVDESEIPSSREFRNAWEQEGTKCIECPIKSREIVKDKRNKKLEEIDNKVFIESRKPEGDAASMEHKAQILRDIPQRNNFDTCSIDDLKLIVKEIEEII